MDGFVSSPRMEPCWENNPNKIQINSWKQNFHQFHVKASVKREKQMQKKTYDLI